MPMDVLVFYAGLLAILVGSLCLVRPVARLGIRTRRAAGLVLGTGLLLVFAGVYGMGGRPVRTAAGPMKIDELMPVYHFHEVHSIRVHAPVARTYEAVMAVTPREIRFFKTLMGIRALPVRLLGGDRLPPLLPAYALRSQSRQDPEAHAFSTDSRRGTVTVVSGAKSSLVYETQKGATPSSVGDILQAHVGAVQKMGGVLVSQDQRCATLRLGARASDTGTWVAVEAEDGGRRYRLTIVRPGESSPILDVFASSGFLILAQERNREVVIGTLNRYGGKALDDQDPPALGSPEGFVSFDTPGYVKITCNFYLDGEEAGWSRVRTETRIFATDPSARRRFALYWRLIYPGSATIRREWLKAIKRRAEVPLPAETGL